MLIAAMILGLIGGLVYFLAGCAGTIIPWPEGSSAPWWVVALIPIGGLGAMAASMARTKPSVAGALMLIAGAAALAIGLASLPDFADRVAAAQLPTGYSSPVYLPFHAFGSNLLTFPYPLLSLIIGGMLALGTGKKSADEA